MKEPNYAPSYCCLYPRLATVARTHGYALAVHGTMGRDFDLIAVPWIDSASEPDALIRDILDACATDLPEGTAKCVDGKWIAVDLTKPSVKEHGRLCWTIILERGAFIDFSVMPRISSS